MIIIPYEIFIILDPTTCSRNALPINTLDTRSHRRHLGIRMDIRYVGARDIGIT